MDDAEIERAARLRQIQMVSMLFLFPARSDNDFAFPGSLRDLTPGLSDHT